MRILHYYRSTLIKFISAFGSTHTYVGPDLTSPPSVPPIRRRTISHRGISRTISHRGISRPNLLHVITRRRRSHDFERPFSWWITRSSTATSGTGIISISIIIGPEDPVDHVIVYRNLRHRHLSMADEAQAECPGLSYPLSLVVVDHTASSIRTTHKAASGFIYPFEPGLIFVHALRAMEPVPSGTVLYVIYYMLLIPHRQCKHHVLHRNPL